MYPLGNIKKIKIMTDYSKVNTEHFSQLDFEYFKNIKDLFLNKIDIETIKVLIAKYENVSKNGITGSIEFDILGFFELNNNEKMIQVVKPKYTDKNRTQICDLIKERINAVVKGEFNLPETVYENKIIGINYNDKIIRVNEVQRKDWYYILYETTHEKVNRHYVEFVYGTIAIYSQIKEISYEDSLLIANMNIDEIENVILKYR
jgi:hypothetical protein